MVAAVAVPYLLGEVLNLEMTMIALLPTTNLVAQPLFQPLAYNKI